MESQSEFARIQRLLQSSEKITDIEFSEDRGPVNTDENRRNNINKNNREIKNDDLTGGKRGRQRDRDLIGGERNRNGDNRNGDNRKGDNFYNDDDSNTDIRLTDYDFTEKEQKGGNYNLNYLDDYSSAQYGGLDAVEKDFNAIFNKAREYRKRVIDLQDRMDGGKREQNASLKLGIEIAQKLKEKGKKAGIQWKHLLKVSKLIIDKAKSNTNEETVTPKVIDEALKLADNPDKFIEQYLRQQGNTSDTNSQSQSNRRNKRSNSNSRNKRSNSNSRNKRKSFMGGALDDSYSMTNENETHRTEPREREPRESESRFMERRATETRGTDNRDDERRAIERKATETKATESRTIDLTGGRKRGQNDRKIIYGGMF